MYVNRGALLRKSGVAGALERVCEALELSEAQAREAEGHYIAVGEWLAAAENSPLRSIRIYVQGSTALGTTVRPWERDEHDVDLVCFAPDLSPHHAPGWLKELIGQRLRAHGQYAPILEEKPRCWRLNYAGQFHLDITPSIVNPACHRGGELVPDKKLRMWKASNPKGYRARFEARAALAPRMRLRKGLTEDRSVRAEVEPYPAPMRAKGVLRRAVQLAKRNRDVYFSTCDASLAPISIIITTLVAWSYEYCVASFEFDDDLDLLQAIIRFMPVFIERQTTPQGIRWSIPNETTTGENFAERWNENPALASAFFAWQARFSADLDALPNVVGLDTLTKSLTESFGIAPARAALDALTGTVSRARTSDGLSVLPTVGVVPRPATATRVPRNTFYGS